MSAQSIVSRRSFDGFNRNVDDYLDCKGTQFLNSVKYDLPDKLDYKELNKVIVLGKLAGKCEDVEKLTDIFDKIVKTNK